MTERNEDFDQMLDDCYPAVTIGSMTFYPSQILFDCDPIAYQISVDEFDDYNEENEGN
jgi:hypothetical protein